MSDEKQKKIFSKNLSFYLEKSGKSQKEVAKAIGVIPQTFNTWCTGQSIPRWEAYKLSLIILELENLI